VQPQRVLVLREEGRAMLAYGWGFMIFEDPPDSVRTLFNLSRMVGMGGKPFIITVGDVVSSNFGTYAYTNVAIVDGKTRRRVELGGSGIEAEYKCRNSPGTITPECYSAVRQAVRLTPTEGRARVAVEGEEDLLSLVAIRECRLNTGWVVYGHWKGFICAIPCTPFFKRLAEVLLQTYFEQH